jgi:hypothetical protein
MAFKMSDKLQLSLLAYSLARSIDLDYQAIDKLKFVGLRFVEHCYSICNIVISAELPM